jgi:hypothetical protein
MLARRVMVGRFVRRGPWLALLAIGVLLAAAPPSGPAQQPPKEVAAKGIPPLDQAAVDRSIQMGVEFLRRTQNPQGHWGTGTGPGGGKGWAVGYTCLAGLALVECGVPVSDPGLRNAVSGVRRHADELENTYEVALAILFLDRMGEKSDRRIIQMLAGRLISAQTPTGGWGYNTTKYTAAESATLLTALRRFNPPQAEPPPSMRARPGTLGLCIKNSDDTLVRPPPPFDPARARKQAVDSLPAKMKKLPVLRDKESLILEDPKDKGSEPTTGSTDNSNTHFAILGLWAARRHDVPTDRSFALLVQRFQTSQGSSGTWAYNYARGGADGPLQMTCVALLGLAIGHVLNPEPGVRPEKDQRVVRAFAALSPRVGESTGRFDDRPSIKDAGGLYFLWAMERIAVIYDVRQLDKKDWYRWGAETLIGRQSPDGSWAEDGGYPGQSPTLNTAFALMFLKRANLTPDLTRRLTVDTAALTAKVDTTVAPKTPPPTPAPKESTPVVADQPPPKETPLAPKTESAAPTPAPAAAPVSSSTTPAKSESNDWIWIVLLVLVAAAGGGLVLFGVMRSRAGGDDEDEDERPRKKKALKKRVRAEED